MSDEKQVLRDEAGRVLAVRRRGMVWTSGITAAGSGHAGQIAACVEALRETLARVGCGLEALAWLNCFYKLDEGIEEGEIARLLATALPGEMALTLGLVPVPHLDDAEAYVLIEGMAICDADGNPVPSRPFTSGSSLPLPAPFVHGLRAGRMILVSSLGPLEPDGAVAHPGDLAEQTHHVMRQIGTVLESFGADWGDVVKMNRWYSGAVGIEDFEPGALACASYFAEPGPSATGLPVPRHARDGVTIKLSSIAMLGEDGQRLPRQHAWIEGMWDWHTPLPYKHGLVCDGMVFLTGQVMLSTKGEAIHAHDVAAQVAGSFANMARVMEALGCGRDEVCRVLTVHVDSEETGRPDTAALQARETAPHTIATTTVPLPFLAYEGMVVEIDTFGMVAERGGHEDG